MCKKHHFGLSSFDCVMLSLDYFRLFVAGPFYLVRFARAFCQRLVHQLEHFEHASEILLLVFLGPKDLALPGGVLPEPDVYLKCTL